MKNILLDANFILSCVRNKLDFFSELLDEGYEIIVPEEVLREIEKLKNEKTEALTALKILNSRKFVKISLGKGHVDNKIINFAKGKPNLVVATLDKEIQQKLRGKNRVMFIRNKKKLDIV